MPNEETTTKFKVDISELKKAMQDAKREISVANSEFKAVSSSMDNWAKSTDGISAKLKQLDSNLSSQKTILSSLEKQYEAVVAEQGEGSAAADRLKVSINNQKAAINQTEREINNYESSLEEVGKAEKIAAATGKDVAEVLDDIEEEAKGAGDGFTVFKGAIATFAGNAMTGLANAIKGGISNIVGLAEETREYRNEMAKLDTAFTTNKHSTEAASNTYKDLYAILGDEGQAVEASNFLAKLTDNEKDLANWTNIAAGVYGTFGASLPIEGLTEAANETAKVGQVTGPLADALNWAGVSEDKFNESLEKCSNEQERQKLIMDTLNGLYSDAATKFKETNGSVMEANRANADYQATLATLGEKIEPITTKVKEGFNGILQKALELIGNVDMSAFTAKIEEGFNVLTNDVLPAIKDGFQWILDNKDMLIAGLAGIAGGFVAFKVASLINTVVGAMKAFKAANEGATVAQWLMNAAMNANPIMLIVTVIAAVVTALVTFIATNDDARAKFTEIWQGVKDFFVGMWEGICTFFTETIPNAFKTVIDWVKNNFDSLLTFMINPFAGLFQYFYENNTKFKEFVDNAIAYIKELPSKVWTWLSNTISKVTTWAGNMITKAKDAGSKFIENVVNFVKELPSKVWTWLVNVVSKVTSWAGNMASKAKEAATKFVENVVNFVKELPSKVWTWLVNVVSKIGEWGSNLASKGKEAAQKLLTSIVDKVKEIPTKIKTIAGDIVTGLWNGINDKVQWLKDKIKGFVGNVTDWIKEFFGIHSPARSMIPLGEELPAGLAVGVDKNADAVKDSLEELQSSTLEAIDPTAYENKGKTIAESIADGINAGADTVKDAVSEISNESNSRLSFDERAKAAGYDSIADARKKLGFSSNLIKLYFDSEDEAMEVLNKALDNRIANSQLIFVEHLNKDIGVVTQYVEAWKDGILVFAKEINTGVKEVTEEISTGTKDVTESVEDATDEVIDATQAALNEHQKVIDSLELDTDIIEKEYELWTKINEATASEADKVAAQTEMLDKKLNYQYAKIAQTEKLYHTAITEGWEVGKIQELYNNILTEKIALQDLLKEKTDLSKIETPIKTGRETVEAFDDYLKQNTQALLDAGYSMEQIYNEAKKVSGLTLVGDTANGAKDKVEELKEDVETTLGELPKNFKDLGISSALSFGNGFLDKIKNLIADVKTELSTALGSLVVDIQGGTGSSNKNAPTVLNYSQIINAPKSPNRLDIYRNTKNLLNLAGGVK